MRMKWFFFAAFALFLTGVSCSQAGKSVQKQEVNAKQAEYKFNYTPYDNLGVDDRQLYNYLFNIIRNKLVYLVENSLSSYPDQIGLVFELSIAGHKNQFEAVMNSKYARGWSIFDKDAVPIADQDITDMNMGTMEDSVRNSPKASFAVQSSENSAAVYVRYWILQYQTINVIYYLEKNPNWTIITTKYLE